MKALEVPYEDAHGTVHQNAVLVVNSVTFTDHRVQRVSTQMKEGQPVYSVPETMGAKSLVFSAWMFTSASAMQHQKIPLNFKAPDGREQFTVTLQQDLDNTNLVDFCEQWLIDNVVAPPATVGA